MLPELFDHQDQNVRACSKGLTLELCRWVGKDPVKSILFEKMRDTMKKELEAELVNITGTAKPTRKIRSAQDKVLEQDAIPRTACSGPSEESAVDTPQEIDEYELVDPVDILTPLGKSGFWDGVKAAKWSERKDAVAELTKLASTKRIAPGEFSEICRTLKKVITDVNIAVAVEAIQAIGNLARGLRTHFSGSSRLLLPVLLEKLKEKKPALTEALTQTLQAMHKSGCLNLSDIVEDIKAATKNKVPHVRSLTLNWLTVCIETSSKAIILKAHKEYVPICMECVSDGTPEVRDAAFSALSAIAKLVGMRPLEKSIEKLDDVRRKKLSEMIVGTSESDGSSVAVPSSGAIVPSSMASDGSFVRKSAASMLSGKKAVQAAPINKKAVPAKPGAAKKGDGGGQLKLSKSVDIEDVEPEDMSLEQIESRIGSLIQPDTISMLKSPVWKERVEAILSFKEQVKALEELDPSVEILIRLLSVVPGWNEKNVQVQQHIIDVISHLSSTTSKFPKKCVVLCLQGICERVADIKTRAQSMKCLTTFCEAVGPRFIFERLTMIMKEHKNPKVLSEGLLWMVTAIEDFGVSHLKLKDVIDFCKDVGLQSNAAATRNATIKLIGVLHKFVGPDIKGFLSDVKPALLSALDAEYEKNPFEGTSSVPKRTVKASDSVCVSGGGLDSLPREDISGKITPALLKGLESSDWKIRLESIEGVNKILEEANKRIQPTGTGELFGALWCRLYDSNKNIIMSTLSTVGAVASSMGPAVEKSCKGILSDILKCLGDNKKHMRECALNTLDAWVAAVHLDKMVPYITASLTDAKICADGRKDLFDWLSKQLTAMKEFPEALFLLKPAASAMTDKSADVRKAAEFLFGEILRICGQEMVTKHLRHIHGHSLAVVIERLRLHGGLQGSFESGKTITTVLTSKNSQMLGKSNAPAPRYENRRVFPVKSLKHESLMSAQGISLQSQALINIKDSNKDERERTVIRKFKFEEPRLEHIQDLESDLTKFFREDFHRRLLSSDFKKQVDGIEMLQKALPSSRKEIIEVFDILLRWFVLRFCESNTACILKVLECLPELFDMLRNEGCTMTEAEAAIFLPCLVEKSGHNIEKVRGKMRALMKKVILTHSAAKTFPYILEGLRSRNSRTRIECVDLIGFLLDNHGTEARFQTEFLLFLKSLQIVCSLTLERNGELRKAALNTLALGYKLLGDDIWRYVGKLTEAQSSMLDDRFKWKAREMEKRREGKPGDSRAALRQSVRDIGSDLAEESGEVSRSIACPILNRENCNQSELPIKRHLIPFPISGTNCPTDWNEALDIIAYGSPEQSIEGMKVVSYALGLAMGDPEGSVMEQVLKDADKLVSCLANKVSKTFKFSLTGDSSRSCKYVLNTLMQTFQNRNLAHAAKESTLMVLITELLLWLLDERVHRMDDGSQLLKALNVLMLKILVLQGTIYDVDLDRILQSIHVYLQELGMEEEIRRRAGADDKPLRLVKTVLHELVKLHGTAIKGHLSMVPIDMHPPPIILECIDLHLQTLAGARMLTPVPRQTHLDDIGANNSTLANDSDPQIKQE
ncbi:unnamed protein product [Cuscuta campestris]|uniref:Protein MOR1 n=1 Tax=Cuscuta campestris TaxID=132261 RepID=A0A484MGL7_9ASTE|nr:unnamed protein product [Cuscuta campestris]